jgi:2'-5' RNA ligase
LKKQIWDVGKKFKVRGITKKTVVPHISLVGPFRARNQKVLVYTFLKACKKYEYINFKLSGFDHFDNRVIYVKVKPSDTLKRFRQALFKDLEPMINTVDTDYLEPFAFHSTVAFRDIGGKFNKIWGYLSRKKSKPINQTLIRVTLMKGKKILYEYDFMQKKLLNRKQALSGKVMKKTLQILTSKKK